MIGRNAFGSDDVAFCFAAVAQCSYLLLNRFDQAIGDEVVGIYRLDQRRYTGYVGAGRRGVD